MRMQGRTKRHLFFGCHGKHLNMSFYVQHMIMFYSSFAWKGVRIVFFCNKKKNINTTEKRWTVELQKWELKL